MLNASALTFAVPQPLRESFAGWLARVQDAAPRAPRALHAVTAAALANPAASTDCLFIVADALGEASRHAAIEGHIVAGAESGALANLLRDQAQARGAGGTAVSVPTGADLAVPVSDVTSWMLGPDGADIIKLERP